MDVLFEVLHAQPIRLLSICELMVLIFGGVYLHLGYRHAMPKLMHVTGLAYGLTLLAAASSAALNITSQQPPTPGTYLFAFLTAPAAATVAVCTFLAWRSGVRHRHPHLGAPMRQFRKAYTAAAVTLAGGLGSFLIAGDLDGKAFLAVLGTALLAGAGVYRVRNED